MERRGGKAMTEMFSSPEGYEQVMGRWSAKLAPLFLDFAGVQKAGRVIDVGCGTGSLVQELSTRFSKVDITGIDPVQAYIDYCQSRFHDPRMTFTLGSALELPFPDGHFDQSLSLLVLMFIPHVDKAAREMRRVTKPRGTVAACTWSAEGLTMASLFFEEAIQLDAGAGIKADKLRQLNHRRQLTDLWTRIGLRNVEETTIEIQMDFKSFDDYWLPLMAGSGPCKVYFSDLPAHHRDQLKEKVRERLLKNNAGGPFSLPAKALAVRGTVPG
jgi:ubiquinone/menaquinone biosynthesis C-methylase UbiE